MIKKICTCTTAATRVTAQATCIGVIISPSVASVGIVTSVTAFFEILKNEGSLCSRTAFPVIRQAMENVPKNKFFILTTDFK